MPSGRNALCLSGNNRPVLTTAPRRTRPNRGQTCSRPSPAARTSTMSTPSSKKPAGTPKKRAAPAPGTGPAAARPDEALPDKEAVAALMAPVRAFMQDPAQRRTREHLARLSRRPPQVLLLEGGTAGERLAAAHYWALLLNCAARRGEEATFAQKAAVQSLPGLPGLSFPAAAGDAGADATPPPTAPDVPPLALADAPPPCLACSVCIRMVTHLHRDCFFFDGMAASIKIDDVRAVRAVIGEPPREAGHRIVLFREAQALVEAAANALLKSFEEPRAGTSFLMLAPQRERLLPTLVSRSVVLTLPWPAATEQEALDALAPWEAALCAFLQTGRGFFEQSGARGALDAALVHGLINRCRRALAACVKARQSGLAPEEGLEQAFASLPESRLRMVDEALAECQDSLIYGVNPALVAEWLATRLYLLLPRTR